MKGAIFGSVLLIMLAYFGVHRDWWPHAMVTATIWITVLVVVLNAIVFACAMSVANDMRKDSEKRKREISDPLARMLGRKS